MAMALIPIQLVETVTLVNVLTARELLDQEKRVGASSIALQEFAAECGISVWLERSAAKLAERVVALEAQLRAAPPEDLASLEDAVRMSRTNLVLIWRALERSPVVARRRAVQSAPNEEQVHLRLVQ